MKSLTTSELNNALLDVRKAYRLLYEYQKRVLDTVNYISNNLGYTDYKGGVPQFTKPSPGYNKGTLSNWAWDWLNMYYYEFYFGGKSIAGKDVHLSIVLLSDTGFYDKNTDNNKKTDLDCFNSVEQSQTKLILAIADHAWSGTTAKLGKLLNQYEKQELVYEYAIEDQQKLIIAKNYNLALFLNKETTNLQIKDFEFFCRNNNLQITENK